MPLGDDTTDVRADALIQGDNPAETITNTASPKSFTFSGNDDRDTHNSTDVTISNSSGASATEDITVELYEGVDSTGTLLTSETESVTLADATTDTITFIDPAVDDAHATGFGAGDYHVNITQSGTALSIDSVDEHTLGAEFSTSEQDDGTLVTTDQQGRTRARVDPVDNSVEYPGAVNASEGTITSVDFNRSHNTEHVASGQDLNQRIIDNGSGVEYVVHGSHTLSPTSHTADNVTIRGVRDASITLEAGSASPIWSITGNNNTIKNIDIDCNGEHGVVNFIGDGNTVAGCSISNFDSYAVQIGDDTGTLRRRNAITDTEFGGGTSVTPAIYIKDSTSETRIEENNLVDSWLVWNDTQREQYSPSITGNKYRNDSASRRFIRFDGRVNNGVITGNTTRGTVAGTAVIYLGNGGFGTTVSNNTGTGIGPGTKGILIEGGRDCTVVGNAMEDSQLGLHILLPSATGYGATQATKHSISNNTVTNSQEDGILLEGATLCTVEGNESNQNSDGSSGTYSGIRLIDGPSTTEPSVNNDIVGNSCADTHATITQSYGIEEAGNSDHNHIADNMVPATLAVNGGLSATNTNTTTANNHTTTSL